MTLKEGLQQHPSKLYGMPTKLVGEASEWQSQHAATTQPQEITYVAFHYLDLLQRTLTGRQVLGASVARHVGLNATSNIQLVPVVFDMD